MAKKVAGNVVSPLKCWRCPKELAIAAGPGSKIKCQRCGAINQVPTEEQASQIVPASEVTRPSRIAALGEPQAAGAVKKDQGAEDMAEAQAMAGAAAEAARERGSPAA